MPLLGNMDNPENRLFGALVVRYSREAMLLLTRSGEILLANAAACELFGHDQEALKTLGHAALFDPEDEEIRALEAERQRNGSVFGEAWFYRQDQRFRGEMSSTEFLVDDEPRVVLIVRDISERLELEYQHQMVHAAMTDSPSVICVLDDAWNIIWANNATLRISGYSRDELIGRPAPLRRYLEQEDPETLASIRRALATHGRWTGEVYTRRQSGQAYPLFGTLSRIERRYESRDHYVATLTDISTIRENARRLRDMAYYDRITGLPNRARFDQIAGDLVRRNNSRERSSFLIMIDIDRFHEINQSHGYALADRVLKVLADRLRDTCDADSVLARHAGDTFVVAGSAPDEAETARSVCERMLRQIREPVVVGSRTFRLTGSAGICLAPADSVKFEQLAQQVQAALQHAKERGGDDFELYQQGLEQRGTPTLEMSAALHRAIETGQLVPYFQPIVDTQTMKVVAMEALVRWEREDGEPMGPKVFIPVAERTGLIDRLTDVVLRESCRHLKRLDAAGHPGLSCSVNLSARQFRNTQLADHLLAIIAEEQVDPARLSMEITETLFVNNSADVHQTLDTLQGAGVRIVIDDFGTGYSSLGYLKTFSVDGIKLDRLFLKELPGAPRDEALVATVLALGEGLGIPVVAEGVETYLQARFLRHKACARLQGFFISPALPQADFLRFLDQERVRQGKVIDL